jgi:hypothetical protein
MPIPNAKATMAPILGVLADGRMHTDEEIQEEVARCFALTREARKQLLKNGIPVYKNRTAWGLVYLQNPIYLPGPQPYIEKVDESGGEEIYEITHAGLEAWRNGVLEEDDQRVRKDDQDVPDQVALAGETVARGSDARVRPDATLVEEQFRYEHSEQLRHEANALEWQTRRIRYWTRDETAPEFKRRAQRTIYLLEQAANELHVLSAHLAERASN